MALYDGFFDAVQDEETGEYDRDYSSEAFTDYFGQIVGSGVCIHNNPDSFKVRLEDAGAVVSPGYLFIQGYWLKNDADYPVPLPGGSWAIVAHLSAEKRMIEVEARAIAQEYPDCLVLSLIDAAAGTVTDTRHDAGLCGVIDSAGSLSNQAEYAVNYIDNEIETKLAQADKDLTEQSELLDTKIAAAQVQTERLSPLPVGSIKFSVGNPGAEWLLCNGGTFSATDYPQLASVLGGGTLPDLSLGDVPAYIKAKEAAQS